MELLRKTLLITFAFTLILGTSKAQKVKIKYGKISKFELERKICEIDSSAAAEVLFDKGYSYMQYDNARGWTQTYQRHFRIKVYDKNRFEHGDKSIWLYENNFSREELTYVKAVTYNLVDGKKVKEKLKNNQVFTLKEDKNNTIKKFAFPAIEDGSIIECKYEILSPFTENMRDWYFQNSIPVRYSEYSADIVEDYKYHTQASGFENININIQKSNSSISFQYTSQSNIPGQGGKKHKSSGTATVNTNQTEWTAHNIPAFINEEYVTSPHSYYTAIRFELASAGHFSFLTSWKDVDTRLIENEYFGKKVSIGKKGEKVLELILDGSESKIEKMVKIYKYVQKNTTWSKNNSKYSYKKFSKVIKGEPATTGDINLALIALLKKAGINACPLILSTRRNGIVYPSHPTTSQFNYVIAAVKINETEYLLDATDDLLKPGVLPKRALNNNGRKICGMGKEAPVKPISKFTTSEMFVGNIIENKGITVEVNGKMSGYAAYDYRKNLNEEDKNIQEDESDVITELKVTNIENIDKSISIKYKLESSKHIEFAGNMIYFSPMLDNVIDENPFKLDERKYPVDYAYPISEKIIFQYTIPEGYMIEEMPKNIKISMPEKAGSYKFMVSVTGNKLQVISQFKINKTTFYYDEYSSLKQFYDTVINKQAEKIVLKKK